MSNVPIFSFNDVHYTPNGIDVLRGISYQIPAHKTTVILGPSGAGKSSLLRLLNNLDDPSRGSIHYEGENLLDLDPQELRREVGMLFQTPVIFEGSLRDNLIVAGRWDSRIQTLSSEDLTQNLKRVGLGGKSLDGAARDLSGGEKARLVLARTLLNEPKVLLLDEATAHLDPHLAKEIMNLVRGLQSELRLTLIVVSHDLDLMTPFADNLAVLVDGELKYEISEVDHDQFPRETIMSFFQSEAT